MKKYLSILAMIGLVLLSAFAFAQATAPAADPEVTFDQLTTQLGKVFSDWRTIGLIACLVALVNLLVLVFRFKPLNDFLDTHGWKPYKVYIAAVLGAVLTVLTTFQTGAGLLPSLVLGIGFGFTAVGSHQASTGGNK